jgi:PspA/IM30 family
MIYLSKSLFLLLMCLMTSSEGFAPSTMGSSFVATRTVVKRSSSIAFVPRFRAKTTSSLQMNLFDRFTRVAKANINNVLKSLEEPEKILNQALEDMQVRSQNFFR